MATGIEKCRQKAFHLLSGNGEAASSVFNMVRGERAHRELGTEISVWPKKVTEDVCRLPIAVCEARSTVLYILSSAELGFGETQERRFQYRRQEQKRALPVHF